MATATRIENEQRPRGLRFADGKFVDQEFYRVDGAPDALSAMVATGLPRSGDAHPTLAGLTVRAVDPQRDGGGDAFWVRIGYRPQTGSTAAPDARVVDGYKVTTVTPRLGTAQVQYDWTGQVYFADAQPTVPTAQLEVQYTAHTSGVPSLATLFALINKTNSDAVSFPNLYAKGGTLNFTAGQLLYQGWTASEVRSQTGQELLKVEHAFLAAPFETPMTSFMDVILRDSQPVAGGQPPVVTIRGVYQVVGAAPLSPIVA